MGIHPKDMAEYWAHEIQNFIASSPHMKEMYALGFAEVIARLQAIYRPPLPDPPLEEEAPGEEISS